MIRFGLFLTVVLFCFPTHINGICETGWYQNGLYCYYFSSINVTYEDASAACQVFYADVVFIDDSTENMFLYEKGPATDGESYWIGYERVFKSLWRWGKTGKSGTFTAWDIGEPDGEGSCGRITPYTYGRWRDWPCDETLKYVCKKFADCGVPGNIQNSDFVVDPMPTSGLLNNTVLPMDSTATYTCTAGYEFSDATTEKTTICSIGGAWVPDITDTCEPLRCPVLPTYEHTVTNATANTRDFGEMVFVECLPGYWFHQFDNATKYLTCNSDKTWTGGAGVKDCEKVSCVRPITSNARANKATNNLGTIVTYECLPGFEYPDNTSVKVFECGKFGWIPPPTKCEELKCDNWTVVNAKPTPDRFPVQTLVTFTCDKGMRYPDTTSRKQMYCKLDENWDSPIYDECQPKECEANPPNASLTFNHDWNGTLNRYIYQDVINYTCIDGWFFSDGKTYREVVCNEEGLWTPSVISDCVGEVIEAKDVTHPAVEAEAAQTVGGSSFAVVVVVMVLIVVFDIVTFGKHIDKLRNNLFNGKFAKNKKTPDQATLNSDDLDEV